MRRPVAAVTAVVLIVEALAIAFINMVLALAVKRQSMSLGGLAPGAMSAGAWVAGGVFALFLLVCAALAIRVALRDRAPGRLGRIVLIVSAVIHAVLGAAVVGIAGWLVFVAVMVVFTLIVATLMLYGDYAGQGTEGAAAAPGPTPTSP